MNSTAAEYGQLVRDRRAGLEPVMPRSDYWPDVKPHFYADALILGEDALVVQ